MSAQAPGHWEVSSTFVPARPEQMKKRVPMKCASGQVVDVHENAQLHTEIVDSLKKGLIDTNDVDMPVSENLDVEIPRQVYRRKVTKMVEVPVTRKVKVPTTTQQIVPDVIIHKIKVPKQIEVPSFKWVDEEYTEMMEEEAVRMKEIWTKKMVPEKYTKKVEIVKTRQIKVPTTEIQTIEEEQEVELATTKVIDVVGFRVDEIKETKHVEIEGWQEVELVPRVVDTQVKIESTKEVEVSMSEKYTRRIEGAQVFDQSDARLQSVDTDSEDDDGMQKGSRNKGSRRPVGSSYSSSSRSTGGRRLSVTRSSPRAHRFVTTANNFAMHNLPTVEFTSDYADSPMKSMSSPRVRAVPVRPVVQDIEQWNNVQPRPPTQQRAQLPVYVSYDSTSSIKTLPPLSPGRCTPPQGGARMFGFRLVEKDGLLVTNVLPDGYAEMAGIEQGDTIVAADSKAVHTVRDWRNALGQKHNNSTLHVTINKPSGEVVRRVICLTNFDPQQYM